MTPTLAMARAAYDQGSQAHTGSQEPNYAAEMRLPPGKTCADCVNGPRCDRLFGAVRRRFTSCDFWPSRYRALQPQDPTHAE